MTRWPDLIGTGVLVDLEDRVVVLSGCGCGGVVRFLVRSRFACTHSGKPSCSERPLR